MPSPRVVVAAVVLLVTAACSGGGPGSRAPASSAPSPSTPTMTPTPTVTGAPSRDRALARELVAMQECDQGRCSAEQQALSQQDREQRLKEIVAAHGWPTWPLVGRRGESAAWLIAQHADLDPAFQRQALDLLRDAVERGVASPANLAYLDDRVAVADGRPQTYGTQIRCTAADGGPEPATPITDPATVEERRADVGIEPLSAYLSEMTQVCAADQ